MNIAHHQSSMDSHNIRRKDTTKGPPLRVLSLDGGGVRGYSMLIILQELMYRAYVETEGRPPKRDEIPKPCDYFDLIAGTGTGGLIAIMLGRLRLDIETCMDVYVRMTKKVFETDKTFGGIPYKSTLFKASQLEQAIKQCVAEHTIYADEGNDGTERGGRPLDASQMSPISPSLGRNSSVRSNHSFTVTSPSGIQKTPTIMSPTSGILPSNYGNPNASLYDDRETRTKTAVTAVYKDTARSGPGTILLRSYDSRKEPSAEADCTIWEAGRATSATGLAFKPIKIGQSVFIDEGAGKYNPSPQVLEEAIVNEWPSRDLGIFVSIGTGKRPDTSRSNDHQWYEGFLGGSLGNFAEARRRLIAKIEDCETIHQQMLRSELPRYRIPRENYARLNVEVGVGEFGMNEWDRLSDMTIGTRRYLKKQDTQDVVQSAAYRLAKIQLMHRRLAQGMDERPNSWHEPEGSELPDHGVQSQSQADGKSWPAAVELPAEPAIHGSTLSPLAPRPPSSYQPPQPQMQFRGPGSMLSSHTGSIPYPDDTRSYTSHGSDPSNSHPPRRSHDSGRERYSNVNMNSHDTHSSNPIYSQSQTGQSYSITGPLADVPPRPPKTPINDYSSQSSQQLPPSQQGLSPNTGGTQLRISSPAPPIRSGNSPSPSSRPPYPLDDEGPPPPVNKARKPTFIPG